MHSSTTHHLSLHCVLTTPSQVCPSPFTPSPTLCPPAPPSAITMPLSLSLRFSSFLLSPFTPPSTQSPHPRTLAACSEARVFTHKRRIIIRRLSFKFAGGVKYPYVVLVILLIPFLRILLAYALSTFTLIPDMSLPSLTPALLGT